MKFKRMRNFIIKTSSYALSNVCVELYNIANIQVRRWNIDLDLKVQPVAAVTEFLSIN